MPLTPDDRKAAAQKAMEMYQMQAYSDPIYGKKKAALATALNRNDPNSLVSQAITAAGGNPLDYTTGALVGKGVKAIANMIKK